MSKHTPGPWKWESDSNGYTYLMSETKEPNSVAKDGFIYPMVVRVGYDTPSYNRIHVFAEISKEDARLIAAAPDMLDALKGLVGGNPVHHTDPLYPWRLQAIDAIAKAEGTEVLEQRDQLNSR